MPIIFRNSKKVSASRLNELGKLPGDEFGKVRSV